MSYAETLEMVRNRAETAVILPPPRMEPSAAQLKEEADSDAQIFIGEMDAVARELAACYPILPGTAQAAVLAFGHALAKLRSHFTQKENAKRS